MRQPIHSMSRTRAEARVGYLYRYEITSLNLR